MTACELNDLKARIAKAEAARDLSLAFCRIANELANKGGSSVEIRPDSVHIRYGGQSQGSVEFDATELRELVINELVTRQMAATKEFQDA